MNIQTFQTENTYLQFRTAGYLKCWQSRAAAIFDHLNKIREIADSCGLMPLAARLELASQISAALQDERNKFDDKTMGALHLFGDSQIKMIAEACEKASAYTNLVILAGYAGLFALWQFARDHLSRGQTIWVAFLLLISIAIFVIYEIYKAYFTTRLLRDYSRVFQDPGNTASASAIIKAMNAFDAEKKGATILAYRVWGFAFLATTVTGLAAATVLAYAFIRLIFT